MRPPPSRNFMTTQAFTLVELLVVIGIIAFLFALSLPVFQSAQSHAIQAKSLNNLHGIGAGIGMYMTDNRGAFPAACNSSFSGSFWTQTLAPYVPPPVTLFKFGTATTFSISPVFVDPLVPGNRHHPEGDYGANSDIFSGPTGWPITTNPVSSLALAGRLSQVIAVITAQDNSSLTPPCGSWYFSRKGAVTTSPGSWTGSYPSDHQTGHYLCLFTDLHTEILSKDYFLQNLDQLLSLQP